MNFRFTQTNDLVSNSFASFTPAVGLEFGYIDLVFVRAGVGNFQSITQLDGTNSLGFQPNIGIGFKYKGIQVDYVECYWRLAPVIDHQMRRAAIAFAPQIVLLQSGDTLKHFHAQLAPTWRQSHHLFQLLVPSWRVADMARHMGYAKVLVSKGASDQAICDTLSQL